jgi:hypothetical protein
MYAERTALLYYCKTCWLSCGKVLHKIFELKEEIHISLSDVITKTKQICQNEDFIHKLASFLDIFKN